MPFALLQKADICSAARAAQTLKIAKNIQLFFISFVQYFTADFSAFQKILNIINVIKSDKIKQDIFNKISVFLADF